MPITASLGALSYSKTNLGADYEYWFLQTSNNYTFNSLTFDASNNFYINDNSGILIRFAEAPFPVPIWTKGINNVTESNYIVYNAGSNDLSQIGSTDWQSTVFPNPIGSRAIYGNIDIGNPVSETVRAYGSVDGSAARYAFGNILVNKNSTDKFIGGKWIQIDGSSFAYIYETNTGYRGGINSANANTYGITGIALDSTNRAVFLGTTETTSSTGRRVIIGKLPSTPPSLPNLLYPAVWQRQLTSNQTLLSQKMKADSSYNYYLLLNDSSYGYLVKYNDSGTIQWQRRIANTTLYDLTITGSDVYVVGKNSSNNLFVAKYNNSGTIQWQTKMSGLTFTGNAIQYTADGLYITGSGTNKGIVTKLPVDGSIPGTGSYYLGGTTTLNYTVATQSESAGTLTEAINSDAPGGDTPSVSNSSKTITNITNTNIIISL
jgi:hypothetical protein